MSNQPYGYTAGSYGGATTTSIYTPRSTSGDTASRYSIADSQSPLSSSMRYNTENYSTRISGMSIAASTHSYGPPGVDAGSTDSDSLYAGLKRSSAESLYHQSLLDAYSKIGQTEAWYSPNSLSKRPRYESTSHLPIYPQRPGETDCAFYMQTRTCKFGESCKFDHPIWVPEGGIPDWKEVPPLPSEALPERPGQADCPFFLKTQRCKFGIRCRFNHPKDRFASPGALDSGDVSVLPERPSEPPCTFYMKTGTCKYGMTCKFHHPKDVQILSGEGDGSESQNKVYADSMTLQTSLALLHNTKGLPIRPGEEDCPFYLKTGSCKYGVTCRYNHPDRYSAIAPTLLTSPSAHFNIGLVGSTASLLPTLGYGATVYPQRPGQAECDFYMKTGICKFGITCKFNHPLDRSNPQVSATESQHENVKLTLAGLPRREGAIHCPYYMKTGTCKYTATCKFDHPPPGEVMGASSSAAGEE